MFKRPTAAALLVGLFAAAGPAQAMQCAPRTAMIEGLQADYKESLTAGGLQSENIMMEVWASEETGTFTVILTTSSGVSCIVAAGTNWFRYEAEPAGVSG